MFVIENEELPSPRLPIRTLPMALLLLAGLVLARSAAGQPHACVATASVPPAVNVERITALVADLVVTCAGGTPTAAGVDPPGPSATVRGQQYDKSYC